MTIEIENLTEWDYRPDVTFEIEREESLPREPVTLLDCAAVRSTSYWIGTEIAEQEIRASTALLGRLLFLDRLLRLYPVDLVARRYDLQDRSIARISP